MSWVPFVGSWLVGAILINLILWRVGGFFLAVFFGVGLVCVVVWELLKITKHYGWGFVLFLFSEVAIFLRLFVSCF